MRDKPDYCYTSNCPLANKGRGFALGCGDPSTPISIMFERPAQDEISYTFGGPRPAQIPVERWEKILAWQREEYKRRLIAFPELDTPDQKRFAMHGAPVRGMSGAEIRQWVLPYVGGEQELEGYFLENVLHCGAPDNQYPTGEIKDVAEACCTHWNRLVTPNKGGVSIVSLHPAGLLRDTGGGIVALPLQQDTFSKAISFSREGAQVLILAGEKAVKFWLGYAGAVTRWAGHYIQETEVTWRKRMERWRTALELLKTNPTGLGQKKRAKGPTAPKVKRNKKQPPIPGMAVLGV